MRVSDGAAPSAAATPEDVPAASYRVETIDAIPSVASDTETSSETQDTCPATMDADAGAGGDPPTRSESAEEQAARESCEQRAIEGAWGDDLETFLDGRPMNPFGARPRVKAEVMSDRDIKRLYWVCMFALLAFILLNFNRLGFEWQWSCSDACGVACTADTGRLTFDDIDGCDAAPSTGPSGDALDNRSFHDPERAASRWLFGVTMDTWNFDAVLGVSIPKPWLPDETREVQVRALATVTILRMGAGYDTLSNAALMRIGRGFALPLNVTYPQSDVFASLSAEERAYVDGVVPRNATVGAGAHLLRYLTENGATFDTDSIEAYHRAVPVAIACDDVSRGYLNGTAPPGPDDDTHCPYDLVGKLGIGRAAGEWVAHVALEAVDVVAELDDDEEAILSPVVEAYAYADDAAVNETGSSYLRSVHHPRLIVLFQNKDYKIAEACLRMLFLLFAMFMAPHFFWKNSSRASKVVAWSPEQVWAGTTLLTLILYINPAFIASVYKRDEYGSEHSDNTGIATLQVLERLCPVVFYITFLCFIVIIPCNVAYGKIRSVWFSCGVNVFSLVLACVAVSGYTIAIMSYVTSSGGPGFPTKRLVLWLLLAYFISGVIVCAALIHADFRLSQSLYTATRFEQISLRLYIRLFVPVMIFVVAVQAYEQIFPHALARITERQVTDLALLVVGCVYSLVFAVLYTPLSLSYDFAPPPPHTQQWLLFRWTDRHYAWWHHYGASLYFFITEDEEREFETNATGVAAEGLAKTRHALVALGSLPKLPQDDADPGMFPRALSSRYDPEHHFTTGRLPSSRRHSAAGTREPSRSASIRNTSFVNTSFATTSFRSPRRTVLGDPERVKSPREKQALTIDAPVMGSTTDSDPQRANASSGSGSMKQRRNEADLVASLVTSPTGGGVVGSPRGFAAQRRSPTLDGFARGRMGAATLGGAHAASRSLDVEGCLVATAKRGHFASHFSNDFGGLTLMRSPDNPHLDGSVSGWRSRRRRQNRTFGSFDDTLALGDTLRRRPGGNVSNASADSLDHPVVRHRNACVAVHVPLSVPSEIVSTRRTERNVALPSENPYVQALERGGKLLKKFQANAARQWNQLVTNVFQDEGREDTDATEGVDNAAAETGSDNPVAAVPMFCLESCVECMNMAWLVYMYECPDGADWLLEADASTVSTPSTASTGESGRYPWECAGDAVYNEAQLRWYTDFTRVPFEFRRRDTLDGFKRCEWFVQGMLEAMSRIGDDDLQWIRAWLPGGVRQDIITSLTTSEVLARREENQEWAGSWGLPAGVSGAWRDVSRLLDNTKVHDPRGLHKLLVSVARVFKRVDSKPRLCLPFDLEDLADGGAAEACAAAVAYLKGQVWVMANLPELRGGHAHHPVGMLQSDMKSMDATLALADVKPRIPSLEGIELFHVPNALLPPASLPASPATPSRARPAEASAEARLAAVAACLCAAVEGCAANHLPMLLQQFAEEVLSYVTTGDYGPARSPPRGYTGDPYTAELLQPFKVPDVADWAAGHFNCSGHAVVEGMDLLRKAGYFAVYTRPDADTTDPPATARATEEPPTLQLGAGKHGKRSPESPVESHVRKSSLKGAGVGKSTEPFALDAEEEEGCGADEAYGMYTMRKCYKLGRDGNVRETLYVDIRNADAAESTEKSPARDRDRDADGVDGEPVHVGPPVRMAFDGTLWRVVPAALKHSAYGPIGVSRREVDDSVASPHGSCEAALHTVQILTPVALCDEPVYLPFEYTAAPKGLGDTPAMRAFEDDLKHGLETKGHLDLSCTLLQQRDAVSDGASEASLQVKDPSVATSVSPREDKARAGADAPLGGYHKWGEGRLVGVLRTVRDLVDVREWTARGKKPDFVGGYERIHSEYYGYSLDAVISVDEMDLRAMVFTSPARVILAFRGTVASSASNVNIDMDTRTGRLDTHVAHMEYLGEAPHSRTGVDPLGYCAHACYENNDTPEIHQGFIAAWEALQPGVCSALLAVAPIGDTRPLYVTGHSLGGALAQLAAYHLTWKFYKFEKKIKVYSLGAPKVGNPAWVRVYDNVVPYTFRVDGQHDPVPMMPPSVGGNRYHHAGTNVTLLRNTIGGWVMNPSWLDLPIAFVPNVQAHLLRHMAWHLRKIQQHFGVGARNTPLCPPGEEPKGLDYDDGQTEANLHDRKYQWPWVRVMPPEAPDEVVCHVDGGTTTPRAPS